MTSLEDLLKDARDKVKGGPFGITIAVILAGVTCYLIFVAIYVLAGLIQDTLSSNRRSIASKIVVTPETIDTVPESILAISRGTTLNSLINVNTHNSKSKAYDDVRLAVELRDMIRTSDAVAVSASKSQPSDKNKIKMSLDGKDITNDNKVAESIRKDLIYGMRTVTSTSV